MTSILKLASGIFMTLLIAATLFIFFKTIFQPFEEILPKHFDDVTSMARVGTRPAFHILVSSNLSGIPTTPESRMSSPCVTFTKPKTSVVLAKTHKTAGSTVATILQRFGIKNNLTFALPKLLFKFGDDPFEPETMVTQPPTGGFHMFVNHVPFNKTSVQNVVKSDAKFVTILRDPVAQFYSSASFFQLVKRSGLSGDICSPTFPLSTLLSKLTQCGYPMCLSTYNGQARDLGQFHNESNISAAELTRRIKLIEEQFDVVLIQDYFDESLVLLRQELCWSFEDMVYQSMKTNKRTKKKSHAPSDEHIEMIRQWNYVDMMLYKHFKRILQERINEYGPTFSEDLQKFRNIKDTLVKSCERRRKRSTCKYLGKDVLKLTRILVERENKTTLRYLEKLREIEKSRSFPERI